jgi:hypothetical protein
MQGMLPWPVCTVFKYVSLQKRYPKLLIKLGTDFEIGQKWKTDPFRFNFGPNNLEIIPYFHFSFFHFTFSESVGSVFCQLLKSSLFHECQQLQAALVSHFVTTVSRIFCSEKR